jgi:hypothetical protein
MAAAGGTRRGFTLGSEPPSRGCPVVPRGPACFLRYAHACPCTGRDSTFSPYSLPYERMAQLQGLTATGANVVVASGLDLGDPQAPFGSVHPRNKQTVRCAALGWGGAPEGQSARAVPPRPVFSHLSSLRHFGVRCWSVRVCVGDCPSPLPLTCMCVWRVLWVHIWCRWGLAWRPEPCPCCTTNPSRECCAGSGGGVGDTRPLPTHRVRAAFQFFCCRCRCCFHCWCCRCCCRCWALSLWLLLWLLLSRRYLNPTYASASQAVVSGSLVVTVSFQPATLYGGKLQVVPGECPVALGVPASECSWYDVQTVDGQWHNTTQVGAPSPVPPPPPPPTVRLWLCMCLCVFASRHLLPAPCPHRVRSPRASAVRAA